MHEQLLPANHQQASRMLASVSSENPPNRLRWPISLVMDVGHHGKPPGVYLMGRVSSRGKSLYGARRYGHPDGREKQPGYIPKVKGVLWIRSPGTHAAAVIISNPDPVKVLAGTLARGYKHGALVATSISGGCYEQHRVSASNPAPRHVSWCDGYQRSTSCYAS